MASAHAHHVSPIRTTVCRADSVLLLVSKLDVPVGDHAAVIAQVI